jgi:hypothetical protein
MTELRITDRSPGAASSAEPPSKDTLPLLRRMGISSLLIGLLGLAIGILFAALTASASEFFRGYLIGFVFCSGISLGCLGLLMMSHLTGGAWGIIPRRIYEAAAKTVPFLFVLFIPLLVGMRWLYAFALPAEVALDEILQHQRFYLNVPFFVGRSIFYFLFWSVLAYVLARYSAQQPASSSLRARLLAERMRIISGPGLFFFCLTVSFAFEDWVMVLSPRWFSTIFGMLILAGQGLSAYAFVIIVLGILARRPPLLLAASPKLWHDLGKLMQAFLLLWAYMSFSQLLIIWAGNLPREIPWYIPRLRTSWRYLGLLLVIGHFAVPFFLLLFRWLKQRPATLMALAGFLLVMRLCDHFWNIEPNFSPQGFRLHLCDIVLPIGVAGLWFACFVLLLSRSRGQLLPLGAPGLNEALAHRQSAPGGTLS